MNLLSFRSPYVIFGVPLLCVLVLTGLAYSSFFALHPASLSLGITIDLVFTVPLLYFLLIRNRTIPTTTVIPCFILGMVVAGYILPATHHLALNYVKTWVLPLVETTVLVVVISQGYRTLRRYRARRETTADFYTAIKQTVAPRFPPLIAGILTTEISVSYYGFFVWRKRRLRSHEFSYHRHSGSVGLLATAIFLTVAETLIIHLLLARWNTTAAWVLTGISTYTAVQIYGLLRSMSQRPIVLDSQTLKIRYGLLSETTFPIANIASVERLSLATSLDSSTRALSPLGELEPPNTLIRLTAEAHIETLYGARRPFTSLALFVDEPERFADALRTALDEPD